MNIRELVWDDRNEAHIAAHDVRRVEVVEVCFSQRSLGTKLRARRYRVIGQSEAGRYLAVFLDASGSGRFYAVTARGATESERRRLQRWRGRR